MQNIARTSFTWVAVAVMALAVPLAPSAQAATGGSAARYLSNALPAGVTIKSATVDQLADAVFAAIKAHPNSAAKILQLALDSKKPRHGSIPCPDLQELVAKAISADVNDAKEFVELANSIDSTCSDQLQALLTPESLQQLAAAGKTTGEGGESTGNGTGTNGGSDSTDVTTPGTTGFTGSPPSGVGAIGSLPVATTPQTTNAG
jgi:hypothetical protein